MAQFSYADYIKKISNAFMAGMSPGAAVFSKAAPLVRPEAVSSNPVVLIVAPHPDDESLMGGYALRMVEEWQAKVHVLPYSYGSNLARRPARKIELENSLKILNFENADIRTQGDLSKIDAERVFEVMSRIKPAIIFSPHAGDVHATHVETHFSVRTAIERYKKQDPRPLVWVQTEYWGALSEPNLLISYSREQVIRMGEALMAHVGENSRNPFHLRYPGWLMDQVRRGSEQVRGADAFSNSCQFGQIYLQSLV